jgi:hypothetical protein
MKVGQYDVMRKPPRHTHKLLRDTAREMAGEFYELAAKDDVFHKAFPSQRHYIEAKWGAFVDQARAVFGEMLGRSDVSEAIKAKIYDALLLDTAARGGDVQTLHNEPMILPN